MRRSISRAVDHAVRIALARQVLREMHPALAAHSSRRASSAERIRVVIDAQVEIGPFLLVVDHERRRLLAALVAARRFAASIAGSGGAETAARRSPRTPSRSPR